MTWGEGAAPSAADFHASQSSRAALLGWDGLAEPLRALADAVGPVEDAPIITPDLWQRSCKGGRPRCWHCPLCEADRERDARSFAASIAIQPRTKRGHRWMSLSAALTEYVAHREDGPGARSPLGAQLDRLREGRIGGQGKIRGDDAQLSHAAEMAELERILIEAAGGDTVNVAALLLSEVGLLTRIPKRRGVYERQACGVDDVAERVGRPPKDVGRAIRSTRRRATIDLVARGLLAPPRRMTPRMLGEVERRLEVLGAKRS